jgi:hypothetical protein
MGKELIEGETGAKEQRIYDDSDMRKYRIELPNLYDDADLDPYEFRLLAHYKRVGNCYQSTKTTAEKCKMSTGKVSQARDSLHEKGFIVIDEMLSEHDTLQITVVDRWAENFAKYSQQKADKQSRSQSEQGVHHMNGQRSPGETKKEPSLGINNNNPLQDSWHKELEQLTGGYMGGGEEFKTLTDAWQRFPDVRRHKEAIRQTTAARSRTVVVYLKAFLTFNPDYVPPAPKPQTTYQRPKPGIGRASPTRVEAGPITPDEKEAKLREWVAARTKAGMDVPEKLRYLQGAAP